MPSFRQAVLFAAIVLPLCATSPAQTQQKRLITDKDLFDFHWIGDTQVAPDGHAAVYVEATTTADHSTYQSSLYLLDLTQPCR